MDPPQDMWGDLTLKEPFGLPSWPLRTFAVKESSSIKGRKGNLHGPNSFESYRQATSLYQGNCIIFSLAYLRETPTLILILDIFLRKASPSKMKTALLLPLPPVR